MIQRGIPWREDETNAGDAYLRNYIRHNVLPAVTARIPRAEEAIGRAAVLLAEENAYFREEAQRFLVRNGNARLNGPCPWVRYPTMLALHPALRRYVLRLACPVRIDWETTERLTALSPGRKMNLPEDWRAECTKNYLHFVSPDRKTFPLPPAALRILPRQNETGDGKRTQALPRRVFEACELRFGKPGDMIRPLGGPGTKKMQDYWVDRKIDRPFRMYMPLLCLENRVVWAIGVGAGEEARVTPGDDAVLLEYAGYLPFDLPPTSDETKAK